MARPPSTLPGPSGNRFTAKRFGAHLMHSIKLTLLLADAGAVLLCEESAGGSCPVSPADNLHRRTRECFRSLRCLQVQADFDECLAAMSLCAQVGVSLLLLFRVILASRGFASQWLKEEMCWWKPLENLARLHTHAARWRREPGCTAAANNEKAFRRAHARPVCSDFLIP